MDTQQNKQPAESWLPPEISAVVDDVLGDADLFPAEIPAIDLYLDQILSLVADKTAQGSPRYREKPLTKTMVNNYSKDGLIKPVKGKKYAKEHIVQMLLVYNLKNIMSIGEVKRLLRGVDEIPDFGSSDLINCYSRHLEDKTYARETARVLVGDVLDKCHLSPEDDRDFFIFLLNLLSVSAYTGEIARALLAARYPDPDALDKEKAEREKEMKEKEKEKERQKKELEKAEKAREKAEKGKSAPETPAVREEPSEVPQT